MSGGGVCAGGAVGLHGGGAQRGVAAGGATRRAAQGGLCRLVVRAACGYVATWCGMHTPAPTKSYTIIFTLQ